jgi:hypothetical protein
MWAHVTASDRGPGKILKTKVRYVTMWTSRMALLTVLAVGTPGCVNGGGVDPTAVDVPAAELSIEPSIIDADPAPSDGKVPLVVQVFHGNEFVKLGGSATLMCNGTPLSWSGLGYAMQIPLPVAGDSLTFSHARGGMTTQFTIKVPPRPTLTSPAAGAMLNRTSSLGVGYVPATSAGVRAVASDSLVGVSGSEGSETGTAYVDVSMLHAGKGTVAITRRYLSVPSGTGFKSVTATYTITSADTAVTWN